MSRRDLLAIDFEGVLKYFRVQLPKKYKTEDAARELLQIAVSMKVSFLSFSYNASDSESIPFWKILLFIAIIDSRQIYTRLLRSFLYGCG